MTGSLDFTRDEARNAAALLAPGAAAARALRRQIPAGAAGRTAAENAANEAAAAISKLEWIAGGCQAPEGATR